MTVAARRDLALFGGLGLIGGALTIVTWVALPTQQGFVALTVLASVGALAVWKRPPTRDTAGRRLRPTTIVNVLTAVGIAAIPIGFIAVGVMAHYQNAASVVIGVGFAVFGLVAFALYSFLWTVTRRAVLAATVALMVAGIVALWIAVPAVLDQLAGRNPF